MLGHEPLFHAGDLPYRRAIPTGERVHVYLDVSGSMLPVKPALYGAVMDCREFVHPVIHLFSTKIADITLGELRSGVCKSTGGTDIGCVADHMAANRIRRALVITDGWTGSPKGRRLETLRAARLAIALLGPTTNHNDLREVADFTLSLNEGD